MPREWRPVGMVAFQVRIPLELKRRLVALAAESGQSQQAIVTKALECYFHDNVLGGTGDRRTGLGGRSL
jgi:hypothetical protein